MNIALTGSSGFVGSHVLTELVAHGHEVTALVRGKEDEIAVAAQGAKATVVDLYDQAAVADVLVDLDGSIHTASPGDATSADLDSAMADAVIEAFSGSGKPHIQISGLWVYGTNTAISEDSPRNPPPMVAWKEPIERRLLSAEGVRAIIPVSGSAYGDAGGGIPGLLLGSPRDDGGNLIMIGEGRQHWVTVHVADLADFFRRALEQDSAHGYYAIGNGHAPTVAELTEAAAAAAVHRVPSQGPTPRRVRVSVITLRRCSSSTRVPRRPEPALSSAGSPPISDSSRSSALAATGSSAPEIASHRAACGCASQTS
jgi:nucleoside-diphosphate-sugar epimerase